MKRRIWMPVIGIVVCLFVFSWLMTHMKGTNKTTVRAEVPAVTSTIHQIASITPTYSPRTSESAIPSPASNPQPQPTTNPNPPTPIPVELVQNFATLHRTFVPIDDMGTTAAHVSHDRIVKIANQQYAEWNATATTYTLGWLTDEDAKRGMQAGQKVDSTLLTPRLVWIISLSGVLMQSSGPPGAKHQTSNEYDIILDAQSGEELQSFTWTR